MHCTERHKPTVIKNLEQAAKNLQNPFKEKVEAFASTMKDEATESDKVEAKLIIDCLSAKVEQPKKKQVIEQKIKENESESMPISIDNIVTQEDEGGNLINNELIELEKQEKLMLSLNLISIDENGYKCNICQTDNIFGTSIGLLWHCMEEHPFRITQEFRRKMSLMRNFEKYLTDADILSLAPEFRLDLMFKPTIDIESLQRKEGFDAESWLSVPVFFGDLLVEIFGSERPREERCKTPKQEWNHEIVWLEIPMKIPFFFVSNGPKTKIGFIETEEITANEAKQMIKKILNTLSKNFLLVATMQNISKSSLFTTENLLGLCSSPNTFVLAKREDVEGCENVCSVTLFIYSNAWTDEKEEQMKETITEWYKQAEMKQCMICKRFYRDNDGTECTKAVMGGLLITRKTTKHSPIEEQPSFIEITKKKAQEYAK